MNAVLTFLAGVIITVASALLVVLYLRGPLTGILVDLCGAAERARFWAAFSNITLTLVPVIFALSYRPGSGSLASLVFDLCTQLALALIGLVCSVVVLGLVLKAFIPPRQAGAMSAPGGRTP